MSETNNNTPMRITQLEEAAEYPEGSYIPIAKAGYGTKKINSAVPTPALTSYKNQRDVIAKITFNYFDKTTAVMNALRTGQVGETSKTVSDPDYWCGYFEVETNHEYVLARLDYDYTELDENMTVIKRVSRSLGVGQFHYTPTDSNVKYVGINVYKYATTGIPKYLPDDYMILDVGESFSNYVEYPYSIELNPKLANELENIRIGFNGKEYSSAGEAVRTQVSNLIKDFKITNDQIFINPMNNLFDFLTVREKTGIDDNGELFDKESSYVTDKINLSETGGFLRSSNYLYRVVFYDENDDILSVTNKYDTRTRTIPEEAKSCKIMFIYADSPLTANLWVVRWPSQYDSSLMKFYAPLSRALNINNLLNDRYNSIKINILENNLGESLINNYSYDVSSLEWEVGSIYGDNGGDYNANKKAIRTKYPIKMFKGTIIKNNIDFNNRFFKYDNEWNFVSASTPSKNTVTIPETAYYRISLYNSELPSDITEPSVYFDNIFVGGENSIESGDFSIDATFSKHPKKINLLGNISGEQSFCIYNDKIYSTNGEFIAVQDLQTLTEESRTALFVGHGNSFQLGSSNIAYISGWDDNNIYCVDLESLTIVNTITLPTSGYTVCVVDDINELAYIFQRDSRPNTKAYYNFIVYDYANETIISTKKTSRAWGSMQSCDFIDGKIFATWGDGTNLLPNGFVIMNTVGNIIGEYILDSLKTIEPEGVFVDRTTFEVYLSFIDQNSSLKICKIE